MTAIEKKMEYHFIQLLLLAKVAGYDDFAEALLDDQDRFVNRPYFEKLLRKYVLGA